MLFIIAMIRFFSFSIFMYKDFSVAAITAGDDLRGLGTCHQQAFWQEYRKRISGKIVAPPFHINGLRSKPSFIRQNGDAFIFGISFHPYGLFPFVRKPLKCLQDEVVDLREMSLELEQKFTSAVSGANSEEIIKSIEHALISELVADPNFLREVPLINDYTGEQKDLPTYHAAVTLPLSAANVFLHTE